MLLIKAECGKMTYTARSVFLQTFCSCPQLISDDVIDINEWLHSFEAFTLQSSFLSAAASLTAPAVVYSVRLVCLYDQLVPFISFSETNDCQSSEHSVPGFWKAKGFPRLAKYSSFHLLLGCLNLLKIGFA